MNRATLSENDTRLRSATDRNGLLVHVLKKTIGEYHARVCRSGRSSDQCGELMCRRAWSAIEGREELK